MPALVDVNCLLAFCYDRHVHNPTALAWLDEQDELSVIVCRTTQLGLLRLLTNATVMDKDVCSLDQAWRVYDTLMGDERFDFHAEPVEMEKHLRRYTAGGGISPKLWQDAYLAAFARAAKLQAVTFDTGFRHLEGLRLKLLSER